MLRWSCLLVAVALATGCGGDGRGAAERDAGDVVRAWAEDLREGRYAAAAQRFGLPAVIANGGARETLATRRDVDRFNRGLTCGAVVTGTRAIDGGRILATFRLTRRFGDAASCAGAIGARAQVTVRVRDGRIVEWLRVPDPPPNSVEV